MVYDCYIYLHIHIEKNSFKLKVPSSWCYFSLYFIMDTFFFGSYFVPYWANCCASWKHSVCYHFHWQWSYRSRMALKPQLWMWNVPIKHTALGCSSLLQHFVGCSCQVSSHHRPVCPCSHNRKEKEGIGEETPQTSFRPRNMVQTTLFYLF